ncbi:hypothetical protein [Haloarcula amylolytica]|uniref:Uncharacterized protein n=1 Tax=Haloarcula amylolytica JCM 13557 TaxID=1227452 RepID=M0K7Z1_9EURY|nr:hypothetical protein [Haloarcula amylolytica]EMA15945.1 hypothetical protein C442_18424 [Haloarcula amylolytica JCM 13557]
MNGEENNIYFGPTMVGINNWNSGNYRLVWASDLLRPYGGIYFEDGIDLQLLHENNNNQIDMANVVWYYEE